MSNRLREAWLGRGTRERRWLALTSALVISLLIYFVGLEPAWKTRSRLRVELPQLREQALQLRALEREAVLLRERAAIPPAPGEVRAAMEESLRRAGLAGVAVSVPTAGRLTLKAGAVDAASWFAWLEQSVRIARVHVVEANIRRAAQPGSVDLELTVEHARGP